MDLIIPSKHGHGATYDTVKDLLLTYVRIHFLFVLVGGSCFQHPCPEALYPIDPRGQRLEADAGIHCSFVEEARPAQAGHHTHDPGVDGVPRQDPRHEDKAGAD